jgi:hypothetical protein
MVTPRRFTAGTNSKEPPMPKFSVLAAHVLLMTFLTGAAAEAGPVSSTMENRLKSSLNSMVQDVHEAETPAEKRVVLDRFIGKLTRGSALLEKAPFLSAGNRTALNALQERFAGYDAELNGIPQQGSSDAGVADFDLDGFASFMQNDLEQANGGVYLSTGAIIIVLLIILILL